MNGFADPLVGPAAAKISGHRIVDFRVGRIRVSAQQGSGVHDLPGLAVAALGDVVFHPRFLERMEFIRFGGEAFDRGDRLAIDGGNWNTARSDRGTIQVYGAGSAEALSATEFSADHLKMVAQSPEKRGSGVDVADLATLPIYADCDRSHGF